MFVSQALADILISIHAPREGSDILPNILVSTLYYFYPRSPRGERRQQWVCDEIDLEFLSTLPARGATVFVSQALADILISIHAPREGSDGVLVLHWVPELISIHAPREGSDAVPSVRLQDFSISIHAPREGSDTDAPIIRPVGWLFLSTLPARGATCGALLNQLDILVISIHAPREGSDPVLPASARRIAISIHAPREGSDPWRRPGHDHHQHFYPRSPRGERRLCCSKK